MPIADAIATDEAEDELYGEKRGDELPQELADPRTRKARIRELLEQAQAERDQIEATLRRLIAHQFAEAIFPQHLVDGANSIGSFGMGRRRQMIEACRMRQEKCCHAGDPAPSMLFARTII